MAGEREGGGDDSPPIHTTATALTSPLTLVDPVRLFSALLYGVFQALPLLHAMHDASHSAIGTSPMGWTAISTLCMDVFAGASINSWLHQHILSHHVYTNVAGADADLPTAANGDYRRITQFQTWTSFYKYQWLFIPPLYTLLGLKFRYQDIFNTLIAKHNGPLRVSHIGYQQVIEQVENERKSGEKKDEVLSSHLSHFHISTFPIRSS